MMICQACHGRVEWRGPFGHLTHTECVECGARNHQQPPDEEEE